MPSLKAKKKFVVIAYDIVKDSRRNKIAGLLEDLGTRINFSVFECMLTPSQFVALQKKIAKIADKKTDTVVYYTICVDCFTKIKVFPGHKNTTAMRQTNIV